MKHFRGGFPLWGLILWLGVCGLSAALLAGCSAGVESGGSAPVTGEEPAATEPSAPTATLSGLPTGVPALDPAQVAVNALASLEKGRLLYNPPNEMRFGESERVEARISLDPSENLAGGLQGSGPAVEENIPVTSFMKVRLNGQAFDITALNSDEQIVTRDSYTQWAWDVSPLKSGDQNLVLTVSARVKIPDYPDETKDLQVVERQILVHVSPGRAALIFVNQNLGWIAPTLLSAIVAASGWAWRRRRKSTQPSETD
jgi:hypothetical protein